MFVICIGIIKLRRELLIELRLAVLALLFKRAFLPFTNNYNEYQTIIMLLYWVGSWITLIKNANFNFGDIYYLVMVSNAFMYFLQVGVLNNFQNGIFNSNSGTLAKNTFMASIKFWVSESTACSSSRQPSFWSRATLAMAVTL